MSNVYYPQARVYLTVTLDDFTQTPAADKYRQSLWLVPETVSVVKNPTTQADSFTITFAVEDFPFLPSQVVGGQAEVYLYQTTGIDKESVILGRDTVPELKGPPPATQTTGVDINDVRQSSNWPVITGTFDNVEIEYSDSGRVVTISGQDYTAYLLSRQWPPTEKGGPRRVKSKDRLDVWLQQVLNEADPELQLQVALSGCTPTDIPKIGSGFAVKKNGIAIDQGTKYWDVITKVCWLHGFSVYVDGEFVVLMARRAPSEGKETPVYNLSWKENIAALKASRKLGKEKAPQIIVQSYDPKTKKTVYGEYPPGAEIRRRSKKRDTAQDLVYKTPQPKPKAGSKPRKVTDKSSEEYEVIPSMEAISDVTQLNRMAKDRYELAARGQYKMTVQTSDLYDSYKKAYRGESAPTSRDLLKLKSGDIMFIHFDPFDLEKLNDMSSGDPHQRSQVAEAQRYEYIKGLGYNLSLVDFLASNYNLIDQLQRPFVVSEVKFDYSVSDGIDIEIQLIEAINADPDPAVTTNEKRKGKFPAVKPNP